MCRDGMDGGELVVCLIWLGKIGGRNALLHQAKNQVRHNINIPNSPEVTSRRLDISVDNTMIGLGLGVL